MERIDGRNHVTGLKQSKKAVLSGRAEVAYLAMDADAWIRESFSALCAENEVEIIEIPTMKELAKGCHVEVPTAVACLCKNTEDKTASAIL